ncbi:hypothetical protein ACVB8X_07040 [Streptomyces sp. NRAIS4]
MIYRVITFAKGDKIAYLGTTLLDPEQHPATELVRSASSPTQPPLPVRPWTPTVSPT